jgi:putative aldouronate transport system substrate-binding protein
MENGIPTIINRDKHNQEVAWTSGDYTLLVPYSVKEPFESKTAGFNPSIPLEREGYELYKEAIRLYMSTTVPYADLTHSEHMPQLPADLQIISANLNMKDFFYRAIVSGSSYTVDQAMRDARAAWERGGGLRIDEWYSNWYKNERHNAFLAEDIYQLIRQQNKIGKLQ